MSTAATSTGAEVDPTVPLAPAGGRLLTDLGHTTISPRVCEKIATRAATEIDGVGVVRSGLARLVPWSAAPAAGATADVRGDTVSVDLSVRIRYPLPVAQTARQVRRQVVRRLGELAGLDVRDVAITVAELADGGDAPRRRVE